MAACAISPERRGGAAGGDLVETGAAAAGRVGGQGVEREETAFGDLAIGLLRLAQAEGGGDIDRDVVSPGLGIEEEAVQA